MCNAIATILYEIGGVATSVGDETVGEMWSLLDDKDILYLVDCKFADNFVTQIKNVIHSDVFHVVVNVDSKADRSKRRECKDPDMLLHSVKETIAKIVVRAAKFETAADYVNQAFTKPTIVNWEVTNF